MLKRILLCIMLLLPVAAGAASDMYSSLAISSNVIHYTQQQLQLEKTRLAALNADFTRIQKQQRDQLRDYILKGITKIDLAHAALSVTNARAMVGNMQIALANANEALSLSTNLMQELENRLHAAAYLSQPKRQEAINKIEIQQKELSQLIAVQQARLNNLQTLFQMATRHWERLRDWHARLQGVYRNQLQRHKIKNLYAQSSQLQSAQQQGVERLNRLQQQMVALLPTDSKLAQKRANFNFKIFITQESLSIIRLQLFLNQLQARQPLIVVDPSAMSVSALHAKAGQASGLLNELGNLTAVIDSKVKLIEAHRKLITENATQGLVDANTVKANNTRLDGIVKSYKKVQSEIGLFQSQLKNYHSQIDDALKRQFAIRQKLPGFNLNAWVRLLQQVLVVPALLWRSLVEVVRQVYTQIIAVSSLDATLYALAAFLLVVGYFVLRKSFISALQALEESSKRFSSKVLASMITLVRRNLGTLFLIIALLSLLLLFNIDIRLWLFIAIVYLSYRVAVNIARMWLLESDTDVAGKDVRLYKGLHWVFGFAAIFSVLMVMAHSLPVSYEVRILFNKIFMLLLLIFSLLLFRAWPVLPVLLKRVFTVRRAYIYRVIRLICWVLPITLFSNAVIGLVGYIDLAWVMGKYQATFLLVLAVYMIIRGLLIDFMELIYDMVIDRVRNGWLWARAFVKPLDRIFRIGLFVLMIFYLLHAYGLDKNPAFIAFVEKVATTKLAVLFSNPIDVLFILEVIVFVAILYWIAKWSREFAFRWLYLKTKDIGARNALAVFTQYAVVIMGVIIGLRILGIDLKGLAVVAAAFAAAVGFGLRDIIANFFSGVILLAERPFRAGDTISLGAYEGEVLTTGIRSMKIRTWDHMEVIVPNTEMFTQPFTNWTHQDAIVRSVIRVNIDRRDDPHRVQQLILNILVEMPCVQNDPYPQVFMKEMSESLIELEVRFFLNLEIEKSRARVRSEVLFAIWDIFKRHGIRAPFPRYDLALEKD